MRAQNEAFGCQYACQAQLACACCHQESRRQGPGCTANGSRSCDGDPTRPPGRGGAPPSSALQPLTFRCLSLLSRACCTLLEVGVQTWRVWLCVAKTNVSNAIGTLCISFVWDRVLIGQPSCCDMFGDSQSCACSCLTLLSVCWLRLATPNHVQASGPRASARCWSRCASASCLPLARLQRSSSGCAAHTGSAANPPSHGVFGLH